MYSLPLMRGLYAPMDIKWDTKKLLEAGCLLFTTSAEGVLCRELRPRMLSSLSSTPRSRRLCSLLQWMFPLQVQAPQGIFSASQGRGRSDLVTVRETKQCLQKQESFLALCWHLEGIPAFKGLMLVNSTSNPYPCPPSFVATDKSRLFSGALYGSCSNHPYTVPSKCSHNPLYTCTLKSLRIVFRATERTARISGGALCIVVNIISFRSTGLEV